MQRFLRIGIVISLFATVCAASANTSAFARGAAPSIMNSPGYQRALEESRRRYRLEVQPPVRPQPTHPRKKKRHRTHHH
ncbi:hypothetical protein HMPREF9696_04045 [Afipia clevelandensis ATCC 49720]|uniref:Uncharacterized protein n=1 Tax=Afipia clevelandensis ATCC 49720 TaxID=883079 RepID=K8NTN1_9BRAD|nr:hypothetical protein HMPREF9696_04045 [Afipia clevelandensis ATCC 49720]